MNPKAQLVNPFPPVHRYIKGTETPNYYPVAGETVDTIWGSRPLEIAVPTRQAVDGEQARVRVVPKEEFGGTCRAFLESLGLTLKTYQGGNHWSVVTSRADTLLRMIHDFFDFTSTED